MVVVEMTSAVECRDASGAESRDAIAKSRDLINNPIHVSTDREQTNRAEATIDNIVHA